MVDRFRHMSIRTRLALGTLVPLVFAAAGMGMAWVPALTGASGTGRFALLSVALLFVAIGTGLVLVQVNTSGEESKSGLAPEQLPELLSELEQFETLRVTGLMTIAMDSEDEQRVRGCFRLLRQLRDRARAHDRSCRSSGGARRP